MSKSKEVQVLFSRSASVAAIPGVKVEKELKILGLHIDNSFSFNHPTSKKLSKNVNECLFAFETQTFRVRQE